LALKRPFALPIHRWAVHMVQRTLRRRLPAVFRLRPIVDLMGVEPTTPTLQGSVAPNGMQARGNDECGMMNDKLISAGAFLNHHSEFILHPSELQAPVSNRAHRPYDDQLGTCRACNRVTKGRVELPRPQGARRSERRVSTGSTTWLCHVSDADGNRTRVGEHERLAATPTSHRAAVRRL
jgi:hypothetical protein